MCTHTITHQARLFICTGTPVQPHDAAGLEDLDVDFRWAEIPPRTVPHLGLDGIVDNVHVFRKHFESAGAAGAADAGGGDGYPIDLDEDESGVLHIHEPFVPDQLGSVHTLPDGVKVAIRMRFCLETGRYLPEWLLPNRRPHAWHGAHHMHMIANVYYIFDCVVSWIAVH